MNEPALGQPWWEALPDDYYRLSNHTHLHDSDPLKVAVTAGADHVLRSGLGSLIGCALLPYMSTAKKLEAERRALEFYQGFADRADAEAVFKRPEKGIDVLRRYMGSKCLGEEAVRRWQLSFRSRFRPLQVDMTGPYLASTRNRVAHAEYWTKGDRPRPTLMFVHGYMLSSHAVNRRMFELQWFVEQGFDVLQVTMPFHGQRAESWHPWSGYGFLGNGLAHLNEAMLHTIHDLRVWMDYLESQGVEVMGLSGLSLGGYISALLPNVDERLAFAIPNSPVVAPIDMCQEWLPLRWLMRVGVQKKKFTLKELRHSLALHSPLTYQPKISAERLLVIAGAGDRFTPPRFVELLHRHWQGSRIHWFPGNHILHLQRRSYLRNMLDFMKQNSLVETVI